MALSDKARRLLEIAVAGKPEGEEVAEAIDASTSRVAASVADLNQTVSVTYDDAEVQAISNKVDELLAALRAAGLMQ